MADMAKLTTREIMSGYVMKVRIAPSFTLRTRIALWLIGLAGRVLTVPVEIELRGRDG